jgi:hypothetical protein
VNEGSIRLTRQVVNGKLNIVQRRGSKGAEGLNTAGVVTCYTSPNRDMQSERPVPNRRVPTGWPI